CIGSSVNFIVTGLADYASWQLSTDNGNNWTELYQFEYTNNSDTLKIPVANVSMNNYQYRCFLSNGCGIDEYSTAAVLKVADNSISITKHPIDISNCLGSTIDFAVVATGSSLSYQWQLRPDNSNE